MQISAVTQIISKLQTDIMGLHKEKGYWGEAWTSLGRRQRKDSAGGLEAQVWEQSGKGGMEGIGGR